MVSSGQHDTVLPFWEEQGADRLEGARGTERNLHCNAFPIEAKKCEKDDGVWFDSSLLRYDKSTEMVPKK